MQKNTNGLFVWRFPQASSAKLFWDPSLSWGPHACWLQVRKHSSVQLCKMHLPIFPHFTRQCTVYKFETILLRTSMTFWILQNPCNIYEHDSKKKKKKSSNTQSGQFLVTHIENQADKMHNISFSNSLGCGNCFALIRSSIQDIMQRTRIHPNRQMHTSSSPIKMLRLLLNCDK